MASKPKIDVAAIATEDGHAIIGGRLGKGEMYRDRTVSGRPLADDSYKQPTATARNPQPGALPPGVVLPFAQVARQHAGREVQRLRAVAAGIERELNRPPIGPGGMVIPGAVERQAANRAALAETVAEIERLEAIATDEQAVRAWAYERGVR